jgi:hypothetical protein
MLGLVMIEVQIETEEPRHQSFYAVKVESASRSAPGGALPCIDLRLLGDTSSGPAHLGPTEARELARYLLALADTTTEARRP